MDYVEYIKKKVDGKLEITDKQVLETEIAELICGEQCPLRKEGEDGFCDNDECIKYLKQFFERYKLVVKVVPKDSVIS